MPQQSGRVHALGCAIPGPLHTGPTGALRVMLACTRIPARALAMQGGLGYADTRGARSWGMPTHGGNAAGVCQHTGYMHEHVSPVHVQTRLRRATCSCFWIMSKLKSFRYKQRNSSIFVTARTTPSGDLSRADRRRKVIRRLSQSTTCAACTMG